MDWTLALIVAVVLAVAFLFKFLSASIKLFGFLFKVALVCGCILAAITLVKVAIALIGTFF